MKAKDYKCTDCNKPAETFFPVVDIDIPSYPYCRKCASSHQIKLMMELLKIDEKYNIKKIMKEIEFPEFYFEGNLYFGEIKSKKDLNKVFKSYEEHMSREDILDKSRNNAFKGANDTSEFGLRMEHKGSITLRKFLSDHKIRFRR